MNVATKLEPVGIVAALAKALPELESAKKNKANPAFKSKYADLAAVIDALEPLRAHGLWYRQVCHDTAEGVSIETIYIHDSGAELSAGTLFMPATKKDAQGFGSALSYARRYSLQAAFGLATEDDDGNAAVKAGGGQSSSAQSAPAGPAITGEQLAKLEMLIPAAKLTPAIFNQTFGIAKVSALPAARFGEAEERLTTRMAELVKAETNKVAENA